MQHTFLWGAVKLEVPCCKILWRVKKSLASMNKNTSQAKFLFLLPIHPALYLMTAGRFARELWWTNQEFSSVDIIPPWFSMLIYNVGDEL
jgi:hypothetical protein